jgi:hypothetical protein
MGSRSLGCLTGQWFAVLKSSSHHHTKEARLYRRWRHSGFHFVLAKKSSSFEIPAPPQGSWGNFSSKTSTLSCSKCLGRYPLLWQPNTSWTSRASGRTNSSYSRGSDLESDGSSSNSCSQGSLSRYSKFLAWYLRGRPRTSLRSHPCKTSQ